MRQSSRVASSADSTDRLANSMAALMSSLVRPGDTLTNCVEGLTCGKLAEIRCDKDAGATNDGLAAANGGVDFDSVVVKHTPAVRPTMIVRTRTCGLIFEPDIWNTAHAPFAEPLALFQNLPSTRHNTLIRGGVVF